MKKFCSTTAIAVFLLLISIGIKAQTAKAGDLDHIWPVKLHLSYITKKQALNSGFWWSMRSGQIWSMPPAFPVTPAKS